MENRFFMDLKYISICFDKLIERKTGFTPAQLRIIGFFMQRRDGEQGRRICDPG